MLTHSHSNPHSGTDCRHVRLLYHGLFLIHFHGRRSTSQECDKLIFMMCLLIIDSKAFMYMAIGCVQVSVCVVVGSCGHDKNRLYLKTIEFCCLKKPPLGHCKQGCRHQCVNPHTLSSFLPFPVHFPRTWVEEN